MLVLFYQCGNGLVVNLQLSCVNFLNYLRFTGIKAIEAQFILDIIINDINNEVLIGQMIQNVHNWPAVCYL